MEKTRGHVDLLILHNDLNQRTECMKWLEPLKGKRDHVLFHQLELNTIWMRDFCPLFARQENGSLKAFDFYYEGVRPKDDRLPKTWSERTACQWEKVEWTLQGGNLISNGAYLGVTTTRIFQDNYIRFPNPRRNMNVEYERRKMVVDAITKPLNLRELVILEPLQSEATRHADMFMTFVAKDRVVVARLNPRQDPVNAAVLDRNARRLASVQVEGKQLEVHRVDIPARDGQSWSAFTNLIIANDLVLMPVYETDPEAYVNRAKLTYQRLMPGHKIKTMDITSFRKLQGELHCLSMNLPDKADFPRKTYRYKD